VAYWTPWFQPDDVVVSWNVPFSLIDKAFGSSACVPAPDASVFYEQALVAMRGDRAITSAAGPTLTGSDVIAATITGGKHTDEDENPGPNYVIDGLSAFPAMGVGFASEYSIPHGPFDPAWDSASAARSGRAYYNLPASAYTTTDFAVQSQPELDPYFAEASDWESEAPLYSDWQYGVSSYALTETATFSYEVQPNATNNNTAWDLDLYYFDPLDHAGHFDFWHAHGDVILSLAMSGTSAISGSVAFPASAFPSTYITGTKFPTSFPDLEPYRRDITFVHRAASALGAYYATGEDEIDEQHASVGTLTVEVTMRPARVRFYIDYPIPPNLAGAASVNRRRFEVPGGVV
jgi:hypothetical protein